MEYKKCHEQNYLLQECQQTMIFARFMQYSCNNIFDFI